MRHARPSHASRTRHPSALLATLATTALLAAAGVVAVPGLASAAPVVVSGTVFEDLDSDGFYEPAGTPAEVGAAGTTVTVTGAGAGELWTTTSSADGTYSVTVDPAAAQVRVEFTLSAAQVAAGYRSSFAALAGTTPPAGATARSGSSVQFLDVATSTTASYGVLVPEDYSTGSADLLIPVQHGGDPLLSTTDDRALVSIPWTANGQDPALQTVLSATGTGTGAYGTAVGTVWGDAYDRTGKVAYTSALLRRFGGLGTANLGGVYRTDVTSRQTAAWIDLEAAGIDVGGSVLDSALGIAAGSTAAERNTARGLVATRTTPVTDEKVFGLVGKVGLGAAVTDLAGSAVYVANLYDHKVVVVPVQADGSAGTPFEVSVPGLAAGDTLFGLDIHHGRLYAGLTSTAAGAGDGSTLGAAASGRTGLGARVVSAPLADVTDPATAPSVSWTTNLTVGDLTFRRGPADASYVVPNGSSGLDAEKTDRATHWNAWSDDWAGTVWPACLNDSNAGNPNVKYCAFPQPVLSAIDFDADGNMVVGFADRWSWQSGDGQRAPVAGSTQIFFSFASGDVYLAGLQAGGGYVLENAGAVTAASGNRAATWTDDSPAAGANTPGSAGTNNGNGPGGGEFFYDRNRPSSAGTNTATHYESTTGALAILTGVAQFPVTSYSSQGSVNGQFYGSGPKWLSTDDGTSSRAYDILTQGELGSWPNVQAFGKAGGLGDLQLLLDAAPVQIGNRVWYDADRDGVQDPGEVGLPGVTVQLLSADGTTVLATTTTNADGEYLFDSLTTPGLEPSTDYQVKFVPPSSTTAFPPLPGYTWGDVGLTSQTTTTATTDSNPDPATGIADVSVGGPGENDHTIDAGYRLAVGSVSLTKAWDSGSSFVTVPTTWSITASYAYTGSSGPVTGSVTIDQSTPSATATISQLPFGVPVTLSEPTVTGVPAGASNSVSWSLLSGSGATVTDNGDGTATLVLADPGTAAVPTLGVGVTNTLDAIVGGFSLAKTLTAGSPASVAGRTFLVDVTYPTGYTGTGTTPLSVVAGGAPVSVTDLPVGSQVTLCEQDPTGLPADAAFQGSTWTVDGAAPATGAVGADGCLTIAIATGNPTALVLSNEFEQVLGGFTVDKVLDDTGDGTAATRVAAHTFHVEARVGGDPVQTLDVVPGQTPLAGLSGIPAGTTVSLREVAPTDLPDDVDWGGATWTQGGTILTPDGSGWVTITIGAGTAALTLTNEVERVFGEVTLVKTVSGPAEGYVGASTTFHFEYQTKAPSGTWSAATTVDLVRDAAALHLDVPAGYAFRIREAAPTGTPGQVAWADRTVTVDGTAQTPDADGWVTVDPVTAAAAVAVSVDNATTTITDGFGLTKTFEGDLDGGGQLGFPAGRVFTVHAVYDLPAGTPAGTPGSQDLTLTTLAPTASVSGLPAGTVVHLSEPTVTSANGDTVTWTGLTWSGPAGSSVAGGVLTFTITAGAGVQVGLVNEFEVMRDDLTITKTITGSAAAQATTWSVEVDYSYTDASASPATPVSGTLTLDQATPTATVPDVPAGAVVTLRESSVSTPPAGTGWLDPVWSSGGATLTPDATGAVTVPAGTDDPVAVGLANPLEAPRVAIRKGDVGSDDASATTIVNDADTMDDAARYAPGETRRIVLALRNSGSEALTDVVVTDETLGGGDVQGLECTFPGETTATAGVLVGGRWTVTWAASVGAGASTWPVDGTFRCTATLTLGAVGGVHADRATVTGTGVGSGLPVTDTDDYNAFTADIQVVKYDGDRADPAVKDGSGAWTIPGKPLPDAAQDANDTAHAVRYAADSTHPVRWVVTNTGPTYLTHLTLVDATGKGPDVQDWVCDLSPVGGPASYSFTADGPWDGLLEPGASFFCHGTLTLTANQTHADTVTVTGDVVVPAVDGGGVPTGGPALSGGEPVVVTVPGGGPWRLTDDDPFHAYATGVPAVTIVKGDTGAKAGTSIVNDADTMTDGELYAPGETRTIVLHLTNTGSEPLVDVVVTDTTLGGPHVATLECRFPGDASATAGVWSATKGWTVTWAATATGGPGAPSTTWATGTSFDCTSTLTLEADGGVHADRATVTGKGAVTGAPVTDTDDYNAFTAGIQVIKYDGADPDPVVKDADGAWVTPAKPLVDADQDADDASHSVEHTDGKARTVRWVVTNTGPTYLTTVDLSDVTDNGPSIASWTCDLSPVGGPRSYSFVTDGPWDGLLAPGASFFCEGSLTLKAGQTHADTVTVTANVVVPAVDADGRPTGGPALIDGEPVLATGPDGTPVVLRDTDPYHAHVPPPVLAETGAQILGLLELAGLLLLTGAAAVGLTRRRRRA